MNNRLSELLAKKTLLIVDGAMGTMLQSAGLGVGECPELWNINRPDSIRQIHEAYLNAGADVILTNTFGGSPKKLSMFGLAHRAVAINRAGAQLAAQARESCGRYKAALIFGSVGPTGELLEPLGTATLEAMIEQFAVQIEALVEGGVDAIMVETMISPEEAIAAASAGKTVQESLPIVINLTYEPTPRGPRTMMGTSPERFIQMLSEQGVNVDGVGTNCGTGADDMVSVVSALRGCTDLPIVAYPNAGMPRMQDGMAVYDESPEAFSEKTAKLADAGATMIGGCCGTTPEHIQHLCRRLANVR
ncbi:MAG TPA: homocysteine S-methyltransferase family protein [bacterium]|nr:homocysteine S-methyltransferase family protein [bacterium]